jgi:hypothetical protein
MGRKGWGGRGGDPQKTCKKRQKSTKNQQKRKNTKMLEKVPPCYCWGTRKTQKRKKKKEP